MESETRNTTEEEVVAVRQRWMCPVEGCLGEMEAMGSALATNPYRYQHICSECGNLATSLKSYPRIVFPKK